MTKPYQKRVIVERDELLDKVNKLSNFITSDIFKDIEQDEQARLQKQLSIMSEYLLILSERIKNFK